MSQQKRGLEQFIRQQLFRERNIPLEKFVLRHAKVGGMKGVEIDEFPLASQVSQDNIPYMVDDVLSRAQNYADGLGNKLQSFALEALVEGAKTGPKFTFRLRGDSEDDDSEDGEEAPTEKGLTSQLMRHNEALTRMLVMSTGTAVQHLQRQLEQANKVIVELNEQQYQQRRLIETANSEQHERDMQMLLTSGQEDRKNMMFKKIEAVIPLIMQKIAGGPAMDKKEFSIVSGLVESLTEDQIRQIAMQLTPEQQMAFFTLYKEAKAAKEASNNGAS